MKRTRRWREIESRNMYVRILPIENFRMEQWKLYKCFDSLWIVWWECGERKLPVKYRKQETAVFHLLSRPKYFWATENTLRSTTTYQLHLYFPDTLSYENRRCYLAAVFIQIYFTSAKQSWWSRTSSNCIRYARWRKKSTESLNNH